MERWAGKVALVTGASSGIGAEIARTLALKGMKVIAVARRVEKLQELAADVQRKCNAKLHPMQCDVQKEEDILGVFKWAEKHLGGIDVLINNAAIVSPKSLTEETTDMLSKLLDVNLRAPAICSREFVQSVKKRKASGHIINISSIAGRLAETLPVSASLYPATKYGVNGMTATLRGDLAREKIDVKITTIMPGAVTTDMLQQFKEFTKGPQLKVEDITDTVIYILSLPSRVEIWDVTVMPANQPTA
ncbi:farnesol dehydrogenase-like [Pseudomyrmex gracilis]|uniref:farnesol dehydrogenase-like n=1 Tax=Pseudomyrmex gracilis TaxID=219809 RepID=UPI000994FEA1|nr:farnesol dehydrogenase-like [Pseudomyrmex gracilis]